MRTAKLIKYDGFKVWSDFFDSKEIIKMENVPVYGAAYVVTLFKLYDKAISTGGVLSIESKLASDGYISYLAEECKTDIPFMDRAMSYYLQHGFAKIAEKDADVIDIHFPYVEDNLITEWDGPEKAEG